MEAEAWKNMDARRRVGSSEKRHPGLVQHPHNFQFLLDELPPRPKVIRPVTPRDLVREPLPRLGSPRPGHVFHARLFAEIARVDQVAAAFPNQSGALPRLILCQNRGQRRGSRGIVSGEKSPFRLIPSQEVIFGRRTAFENSN